MVKIKITNISNPAKKIEVIKMIRTVTGCNLAQAKEYFETVFDRGQCVVFPADYPNQLGEKYKVDFSALGVDVKLEYVDGNTYIHQQDNISWGNYFIAKQAEERAESSYTLFGKRISFNAAAERYFDMLLMLWEAQRQATESCAEWYDFQHNLDTLLSNGCTTAKNLIYRNAISPLYEVLKVYEI